MCYDNVVLISRDEFVGDCPEPEQGLHYTYTMKVYEWELDAATGAPGTLRALHSSRDLLRFFLLL